jgi:hypothetical protein
VPLDEALVERICEATNGNYALGNHRFQAETERALGRRARRGKAGRRPKAQAGEHHSKKYGAYLRVGGGEVQEHDKR